MPELAGGTERLKSVKPDDPDKVRGTPSERAVWASARLLMVTLPIGLTFIWAGLVSKEADASSLTVSLHLFAVQDTWAGPLSALIILGAWALSGRLDVPQIRANPMAIPALAIGAALVVVLFRFAVFSNYGPSLDEAMPLFQAEIFRTGNFAAELTPDQFADRESLQPYFTYVDDSHRVWMAHYRPIQALILSLSPAGFEVAVAHALLTMISVLSIASIARRLFPAHAEAPILAALALLASPQVLMTAGSGFAFTAHQAFNTLWMALFLAGSWRAHIAAAIIGFFALGLHQVHVHAAFVLPFGLAMLMGHFGDRLKALPYIVAYGVGVPVWIMWPEIAVFLQTGDSSVLPSNWREIEYLSNYITRSQGDQGSFERQTSLIFLVTNVWRFLAWMSPALVLMGVLALMSYSKISAPLRTIAASFAFTLILSHVMLPNQMHTIGSRYYHPAFSNIVLIGLAGLYSVGHGAAFRRSRSTVLIALIAGAVLMLPLRAYQFHIKVAPRAQVQAAIQAIDADVVIIDTIPTWFLADFVRNDPFLRNRPLIYGWPDENVEFPEGTNVRRLTRSDFLDMGMTIGTYLEPDYEVSSQTE